MKKGDIVTINDGSYSRSIVYGKLIHESLNYGNSVGKEYTVLLTNCVLPIAPDGSERYRQHGRVNDTVIQDVDSGKIVFIEKVFLRLKYRVPPIREVTLAEICERFGGPVIIRL